MKSIWKAGVGTNTVEEYSLSRAGKGRWVNRGEEGRKQVVREVLSQTVTTK